MITPEQFEQKYIKINISISSEFKEEYIENSINNFKEYRLKYNLIEHERNNYINMRTRYIFKWQDMQLIKNSEIACQQILQKQENMYKNFMHYLESI